MHEEGSEVARWACATEQPLRAPRFAPWIANVRPGDANNEKAAVNLPIKFNSLHIVGNSYTYCVLSTVPTEKGKERFPFRLAASSGFRAGYTQRTNSTVRCVDCDLRIGIRLKNFVEFKTESFMMCVFDFDSNFYPLSNDQ